MPQPTGSDLHVDTPLTNISVAFIQKATAFIADKVFPIVPVKKQSDRYYVYTKADWFRDEAQKRARASESAGGGYNLDNSPTYFADVYAYHKDIDDKDRANADQPLDMDRDATEFDTQKMLIKKDVLWAAKYFVTGKWDTDLDGVTGVPGTNEFKQWDQADSTPIEDIQFNRTAVAGLTGYKPNKLVLSPLVRDIIVNHSDVVDRLKYTQKATLAATEEILAALFGVDEVLVADAVVNSAAEGVTESTAFIMGKNALLVYAPPAPGILVPSAGYTFSWTGFLGAAATGVRIKRFRMEELSSDRIEAEMAFDQKLVAASLGVFFEAAIA